jgi:hypothetical protein
MRIGRDHPAAKRATEPRGVPCGILKHHGRISFSGERSDTRIPRIREIADAAAARPGRHSAIELNVVAYAQPSFRDSVDPDGGCDLLHDVPRYRGGRIMPVSVYP